MRKRDRIALVCRKLRQARDTRAHLRRAGTFAGGPVAIDSRTSLLQQLGADQQNLSRELHALQRRRK